jgi:uncharacterized protein (TIGR00290 family)
VSLLHDVLRRDRSASLQDMPFFCSWSGGKDSCLALHRAVRAGGVPRRLLCMLDETVEHTRSHGLPVAFLQAQARALGIPLIFRSATWDDYERVFVDALQELAQEGVEAGVFGDIDIEEHREWEERVAATAGLGAFLPLWGASRRDLLEEMFAMWMRATIVTTDARVLGKEFIGRELTPDLVGELEAAGSDAAGENGEYHTAVTECPLFSGRIDLRVQGVRRVEEDHWQAELDVERDGEETG